MMMMQTRLFVSLYAGLLVYLVLIFFFGSTGKFAYGELEKQRDILKENVRLLRSQGEDLGYAIEALQTDPDRVVKEARNLLYLREREGVIRITGYKEKPRAVSPGGLVKAKVEIRYKPEPFLRAFALCMGIVVFIFLGFSRGNGKVR